MCISYWVLLFYPVWCLIVVFRLLCMFANIFSLFLFLTYIFTGHRILGWQLFSSNFKVISYCFLLSLFWWEICSHILIFSPSVYIKCLFPLATFKMFFLSLGLSDYDLLFMFLMLGIHLFSWICGLIVFIKFEFLWLLFLQILFLFPPLSSLLPFGDSNYILGYLRSHSSMMLL